MKRCLMLTGLVLLVGMISPAATAFGQGVTFGPASTPTNVSTSQTAAPLGTVTLTAFLPGTLSTGSNIFVSYSSGSGATPLLIDPSTRQVIGSVACTASACAKANSITFAGTGGTLSITFQTDVAFAIGDSITISGFKFNASTVGVGTVIASFSADTGSVSFILPAVKVASITAPPPVASLSTTTLNFGSQETGTTSVPGVVILSNTGGSLLNITGIALTPTAFSEKDNCDGGLAVGLSCTISVFFAPTSSGAVSGSLTISDNATGGSQVIKLTGTGFPLVSVSPPSINFGNQPVDVPTAPQSVTLANSDTVSLSIAGITTTLGFSVQSTTCPAVLNPGANCKINIVFNPPATGSVAGALVITDMVFGSVQIGSLAGVGVLSSATLALSKTSLNFGNQAVGSTSAPQSITMTNTGSGLQATLAIIGIVASPDAFLLNNSCGSTLAAGASCTIVVVFVPTTSGVIIGTLSIIDNAAGSPQVVSLSGTGVVTPNTTVSLSASSLTFANQTVGTTSASKTVTLTNTGTAPLVVTNVGTSGDFSSTTTCGASVLPGATCGVSVAFAPKVIGTRTGSVTITANTANSPLVIALSGIGTAGPRGDFDGDGKADIAVWRPGEGNWYILPSSAPTTARVVGWGINGDIPVAGDYDGDGKADVAVWRPSDGSWRIIPSSAPGTSRVQQFGTAGDVPVPADYDGDGQTDIAVWRPSEGNWYILPSSAPGTVRVQQWGMSGDIPVPGDYDGDGKADVAVWRPSDGSWRIIPSSAPTPARVVGWGTNGDIPVPGDYDGDGKTDIAVWRPSEGNWFILPSSAPGTSRAQQFGTAGDAPVPADYDGDGKTDVAVWRPSNGTWFVILSSTPTMSIVTQWGATNDVPVEKPLGQ